MAQATKTPGPVAHTLVFVCILVAIVTFFHRVFLYGEALVPAGIIYGYYPWFGMGIVPDGSSTNRELFDAVLEFYPWRAFAAEQLQAGTVPLWNNLNFFGHPFLATLQAQVFYPLLTPFLWLFPQEHLPALQGIIHLFIAFYGTFFLILAWKCGRGAGVISGVAYAFGGFMILWLGHPHAKVAAWLPWIFLAHERLWNRPRWQSMAGWSLICFLQFAAGHIQTSVQLIGGLMVFVTARTLYAAVRLELRWRRCAGVAMLLGSLTLGALMHAGTMVPFAEYLSLSSALDARKDGVPIQPYLDPSLIICQVLPKVYGVPYENTYWLQTSNINEIGAGYIGILPLLLTFLALASRRYWEVKAPLLAVVVFSLGVSYGWPVIFPLSQLVPVFRMSYTFRFLLLSGFALSLLAGIGFESIAKAETKRRLYASLGVLGGGAAALLIFANLLMPRYTVLLRARPDFELLRLVLDQHLLTVALLGLLSVFVLFFAIVFNPRSQPMGLLLAAIVFTDLFLYVGRANPSYAPEFVFPEADRVPSIAFLQRHEAPPRFLGIFSGVQALPPHTNMLYGLDDIRGNDALSPLWQERYLGLIDPGIYGPQILPALRQMLVSQFRSNYLDGAGVDFIYVPRLDRALGSEPGGLSLVFRNNDGAILHNQGSHGLAQVYHQWIELPDRAAAREAMDKPRPGLELLAYVANGQNKRHLDTVIPPSPARVVERAHHRYVIETNAREEGQLVARFTEFPGWRATVNGEERPIAPANLAFMGIPVEKGPNRIELTYEPLSYRLGLFVSLATLAGTVAMLLAASQVPRTRQTTTT